MKIKIIVSLLLLALAFTNANAQETLSLQDAIAIALKQNYDIEIAGMNQKSAEMQIYKANAGMSPRLDWNLNFNSSFNNVNQKFVDDRLINRFGRTFAPNTNLVFNYTIYDGNRMQNRLAILKEQSKLSAIDSRATLETVISNVMTAYYNILRQKQSISFLENVKKYYDERVNITEERWNLGRGSKLDYLTALSDKNTQLADLANANNQLDLAKTYLNLLLNRDENIPFDIESNNLVSNEYLLDDLIKKSESLNSEISFLNNAIALNQLVENDWSGAKKPKIGLNASFGYSLSNTNAGLILLNQNLGLNAGISATWNLFDGGHNNKQLAIAKLQTDILKKKLSSVQSRIRAEITMAFNQWKNDVIILAMEKENLTVNEENLKISVEKFRLGGSTILEVNEAQRRYDQSQNRYVNAQYNIKVSELQLLKVSGMLIN